MLTFEEFDKHITRLKRENEFELKLADLLKEYQDVCNYSEIWLPTSRYSVVELLEGLFGLQKDEFGYTTLSWWIFETEFGAKKMDVEYGEEWGIKEIPDLTTTRGVYDLICMELEAKKRMDEQAAQRKEEK